MKYYSTNHQVSPASLEEAVVRGLAADRGLFMPECIPTLDRAFIDGMKHMTFHEIALHVASAFFGDDMPQSDLRRIVDPVFRAVSQWDEPVAIAVLPDHPTPCAIRTHTNAPIPFVIYKPGSTPDAVERYDEFAAVDGSYGLLRKDEFMRVFLK